jgi:hypothetical protein
MKKIALALGLTLVSASAAFAQFSGPDMNFPSFPKEFTGPATDSTASVPDIDDTATGSIGTTGSTGTSEDKIDFPRLGDGSPVYK